MYEWHRNVWMVVLFAVLPSCMQYSFELENSLRDLLFTNASYNMFARPNGIVNVTASLNVINLNGLNIRDQQLITTGYILLRWEDRRLYWNNNTVYKNEIPMIFITEEYVWHPSLVMDNSISDISVMSDPDSPLLLVSTGILTWRPSGIFETYCEVNIMFYPLDTQTCSISLTSIAYTANEIELFFGSTPVDSKDLKPNGEWIYEKYSTTKEFVTREDKIYSVLTFNLQLKRRPLYHILNTLIPTDMLAFLSCFVFKLPAESGEKIGYSLTVVLSYAVYLTLVADTIPSSSTTVSLLSLYLVTTLILGMLSVVLTIFVLDCHHTSSDIPIPPYLRTFCNLPIVKGTCLKNRPRCRSRRKISISDNIDEIPKSPKAKMESARNDDVTDVNDVLTWRKVAKTLDRLFMWTYIVIVTTGTLLMSLVFFIIYNQ